MVSLHPSNRDYVTGKQMWTNDNAPGTPERLLNAVT